MSNVVPYILNKLVLCPTCRREVLCAAAGPPDNGWRAGINFRSFLRRLVTRLLYNQKVQFPVSISEWFPRGYFRILPDESIRQFRARVVAAE